MAMETLGIHYQKNSKKYYLKDCERVNEMSFYPPLFVEFVSEFRAKSENVKTISYG